MKKPQQERREGALKKPCPKEPVVDEIEYLCPLSPFSLRSLLYILGTRKKIVLLAEMY